MVYTKYRSVQYYAIRGLKLGLMSYVFNICRFLIPFLVGFAITGDSEKYIEPLLFRTLGNDILQFAALAFLAMALMEKLKVPNFGRLAIGVLCSIVANFFNGISVGSDLGNIFLGYFVGTESPGGDPWIYSDFPLLNWIIVPICGYLFGTCLQHIKNKNLFYGIFSPICGVFAAVYFTLGIIFKFGMFGDGQNCYYHISTIDVIVSLAAAVGVIGLFYLIAKKLPQKIIAFCVTVSRNINSVYCIHWVLVSWITIVLLYVINGTSYFPVGYTMLISLGISIASILLAKLWVSQIKPFLKGRGKGARV
jgi:hypothetical protein